MDDVVRIGDSVAVVSGPHEGRTGEIAHVCEVTIAGNAEPYALVNITERNVFNEITADQISVPVRRVQRR